ncbi:MULTISPECIES: hypothetical protein [Petrotoga]|uniref:Uncharacterized protein n=2 Tax=Petrotoga sibirica TaxID=156202 RepID=A0A4R8F0U3_9BACT|nr:MULTISPECIES: hypothetical protein [Petrotoga]POZ87870.1 hypothetical protein AA80_09145 [Petrotoga sibirica DSM 13575]POZ89941.1 hypothetical protein AD60_09185 [Petrotoga sp. SL27]TDX16137.1 hypothetical protein C8D74_10591 [Petrotoga sibirica]
MKKILGLAVLMMVMLVSVSGLAQATSDSTTTTVPVFLNVPAFVRLTLNDADNQFNLEFDPADPYSTVEDTVALLAEANVDYDVTVSEIQPVLDQENWANLLQITIDKTANNFGDPGQSVFNATATINVIDNLSLGTVPAGTKIADVIFTITSL